MGLTLEWLVLVVARLVLSRETKTHAAILSFWSTERFTAMASGCRLLFFFLILISVFTHGCSTFLFPLTFSLTTLLLSSLGLFDIFAVRLILLLGTSPLFMSVLAFPFLNDACRYLFQLIWQVKHFGCRQLTLRCNLLDLLFSQAQVDILWFEIGMNNLTDAMQVI